MTVVSGKAVCHQACPMQDDTAWQCRDMSYARPGTCALDLDKLDFDSQYTKRMQSRQVVAGRLVSEACFFWIAHIFNKTVAGSKRVGMGELGNVGICPMQDLKSVCWTLTNSTQSTCKAVM